MSINNNEKLIENTCKKSAFNAGNPVVSRRGSECLPERGYNWAAILVAICCFLVLTTVTSMRSTFSLYIISIGGSEVQVGILTIILTISSCMVRPIVGNMIGKIGPKPFLVIAAVTAVISAAGHELINSAAVAAALSVCLGICQGCLSTSFLSLILNQSRGPEEDASMVNIDAFCLTLDRAIIPMLALSLLTNQGFQVLHYVIIAVDFIAMILFKLISPTLRMPKNMTVKPIDSQERAVSNLRIFLSKPFIVACVTYLAWSMTNGVMVSNLPLFGKYHGVNNVGLFFTVYSIVTLLTRVKIPYLIEFLGRRRLLAISLALVTFGTVGLAQFQKAGDLVIPGILYGLGTSGIYVPLTHLVIEHLPPAKKMTGMGIFMANLEIGAGLGPLLAGILSNRLTYSQIFAFIAIAPIVGIITVLMGLPTRKRERPAN